MQQAQPRFSEQPTDGAVPPAEGGASATPAARTAASWLEWAVRGLGGVALLIGGFWIAAWIAGAVPRWNAAGLITVKTNAAVGLVLTAAALILLSRCPPPPARRWVATAVAGLVLLLGSLTLSEHLVGWNLGIDELLAVEGPGAAATFAPNRMGVPASTSFTLLGIAMLLLARSGARWQRDIPFLGLIVIIINLVPAVGFLYGVDPFFTSRPSSIAWPTVLALISLGLGLVLACPDHGPLPLLRRHDAGGRLLRGLLPWVILLPLGLGFLRVLGQNHGLYGTAMGTGLLMLTLMISFAAMLWRSAARLSNADQQRQRTEATLRESESFFRQMLESIPGMVFTTRPDGYCDYQSQQWVEFTGVPMSEHMGSGWNRLLHPDDQPKALAAWQAAVAERAPYDLEYRVRRHDGQYEWFKVRGRPIRDASGAIVRWFGVATSIEDLKRADDELRTSEQRVRQRLEALLAPAGNIGELELADIIDVPAVQTLMDHCYALMQIPMSIIDLKGRLLVGVGWQAICTEFHRRHPESCQHCIESDTQLTSGVAPGEFRLYRCKNHMWDIASPILVGGKHVGNLFCGQFFFDDEPVDRELFRAQAKRFGFDEATYLAALDTVPRLSRQKVQQGMAFFMKLADMLSLLSYSNIQLARSTEALSAAKRGLEQANAAKDHFLAVLSHELRTPLNPVMAVASLLQRDERFDPETRENLEIIRRNVELEARLIDDLLDVTRIERGKLELDRRPHELRTILQRAVEVCDVDIQARNLVFTIDLGPAPYWVDADPARLQQVFWNLLRNAIKFTPPGGRVGVRCRREMHHGVEFVAVEVSDSGAGIAPEVLPRLFNAFEQGGAMVTRQFGGLGLGLAISKALTEMHGGTIDASSDGKGQGATFTVRLPLLPAAAARPAQTPPEEAAAPADRAAPAMTSAPLRILLVEDHSDTARIMRRLLTAHGHDVRTAGDVASALALVETHAFDLLLSDVGLPDGSGLELVQALRERGLHMPAIALSGFGQEQDIQQSHNAGFAAHLVKPVNLERLEETIARVMAPPPASRPSSP